MKESSEKITIFIDESDKCGHNKFQNLKTNQNAEVLDFKNNEQPVPNISKFKDGNQKLSYNKSLNTYKDIEKGAFQVKQFAIDNNPKTNYQHKDFLTINKENAINYQNNRPNLYNSNAKGKGRAYHNQKANRVAYSKTNSPYVMLISKSDFGNYFDSQNSDLLNNMSGINYIDINNGGDDKNDGVLVVDLDSPTAQNIKFTNTQTDFKYKSLLKELNDSRENKKNSRATSAKIDLKNNDTSYNFINYGMDLTLLNHMDDFNTGKNKKNYFNLFSDIELEEIMRIGNDEKIKVQNFLFELQDYLIKVEDEYKSRKINIDDFQNKSFFKEANPEKNDQISCKTFDEKELTKSLSVESIICKLSNRKIQEKMSFNTPQNKCINFQNSKQNSNTNSHNNTFNLKYSSCSKNDKDLNKKINLGDKVRLTATTNATPYKKLASKNQSKHFDTVKPTTARSYHRKYDLFNNKNVSEFSNFDTKTRNDSSNNKLSMTTHEND